MPLFSDIFDTRLDFEILVYVLIFIVDIGVEIIQTAWLNGGSRVSSCKWAFGTNIYLASFELPLSNPHSKI